MTVQPDFTYVIAVVLCYSRDLMLQPRSCLPHRIDFTSYPQYRPASAENTPEFDLEDLEP